MSQESFVVRGLCAPTKAIHIFEIDLFLQNVKDVITQKCVPMAKTLHLLFYGDNDLTQRNPIS